MQPNNVTIIYMKHFSFLLGLFVAFTSLFVSCSEDEKDSTVCTVTVKSVGHGTVSITRYIGASADVLIGSLVEVAATPDDGYAFTGWYTDESETPVSTDPFFEFVAMEDITLTARFAESLHVTISASNGGDVAFKDISKFNHIWDTEIAVLPGTEVIVIATPDEGAEFAGWFVSDTVVCTETEYTFIVNEDIDLTAQFMEYHEYVDLGLPSGLKWATCNVGATKPEEYGGYYAWGETEEKSDYSWETYKWCNGSYDSMTKYCTDSDYGRVDNKTVLDSDDDVAYVKWGGSWRMPTFEEQKELFDECSWERTELNGVNGYMVTGPNGNSIFLPAAGYRYRTGLYNRGTLGLYWSSSLYDNYSDGASYLYFYDDNHACRSYGDRYDGHSVRPVCE